MRLGNCFGQPSKSESFLQLHHGDEDCRLQGLLVKEFLSAATWVPLLDDTLVSW